MKSGTSEPLLQSSSPSRGNSVPRTSIFFVSRLWELHAEDERYVDEWLQNASEIQANCCFFSFWSPCDMYVIVTAHTYVEYAYIASHAHIIYAYRQYIHRHI